MNSKELKNGFIRKVEFIPVYVFNKELYAKLEDLKNFDVFKDALSFMIEEKLLLTIAKEYLDLETLDTTGNDSLDFHDVSVWNIRSALEAAYRAGIEYGSDLKKLHKEWME